MTNHPTKIANGFNNYFSNVAKKLQPLRTQRYGKFACGVFINLQKAFDTVDHPILRRKKWRMDLLIVQILLNRSDSTYITKRF